MWTGWLLLGAALARAIASPAHGDPTPTRFSSISWCNPLSCDVLRTNFSKNVAGLKTMEFCSDSGRSVIEIKGNMTLDSFTERVVAAMKVRRALCLFEHALIGEAMLSNTISGKKIKRGTGPHYDSYDLLAAIVLSHLIPANSLGAWLELGVFKGSSLNLTAHLAARRNLSMSIHGFDTFMGLPSDWTGHSAKGSQSLNGVAPAVQPGVVLHKGLFRNTLPKVVRDLRCDATNYIVGVNVDCDLYEGTLLALKRMAPKCLRKGSLLHMHDVYSTILNRNPMEELVALFDWLSRSKVALSLLPVRNGASGAAVFIVQESYRGNHQ